MGLPGRRIPVFPQGISAVRAVFANPVSGRIENGDFGCDANHSQEEMGRRLGRAASLVGVSGEPS
jgi:hypothetical protein